MGLFSKKSIVCERCGKSYEVRIAIGEHLCPECKAREKEKTERVQGYVNYALTLSGKSYTEAELDAIAAHRDSILEKYRNHNPLTPEKLKELCNNYKSISDEQAAAILSDMSKASVDVATGAGFTGGFYALTTYEKVVVDVNDIFAVAITNATGLNSTNGEAILCAVFTNDPYIPVFPMIYVGKLGFFEMMKSKKGRRGVSALFELTCPNLQYPVQEVKNLKKQIKADGMVKGNISFDKMKDYLDDAGYTSRIFKSSNVTTDLSYTMENMLNAYGYYSSEKFNKVINDSGMFCKRFWQKQIKRLSDYDMN